MTAPCPKCRTENPADTRFCGNCGAPLAVQTVPASAAGETLRLPLGELATGTLFASRYRIIEELGQGGMGRVYKVYDEDVGEKVALKLLNPAIATDDATVRRFRTELKLARTITHKNVCRMYDLGQHEGTSFITMEYVPGENLKSFIRRSGRLPCERAVAIAAQICAGLAEAHRLGVIHRDLKPQNIMIDGEGNARIMDFGIARSVTSAGTTERGMAVGTPEYMSPEQVDGEEADARSDLYALGAVLFEMLTGRTLFEAETPLGAAVKHKTERPADPRSLNPDIPAGLGRLVLRCLEKDRALRFQTAPDLLAGLKTLESPPTSRAEPAETGSKDAKRRVRSPYVIGPLVAVILVGLAVGASILLRSLRRTAQAPITHGAAAPSWKNSVAVLPFKDQSLHKDQEALGDGMTEALIVRLSQLRDLKVTGTNSVMHYRNTDKDIPQIAAELGVANVLDGTVRREGSLIRVMAELVNGETKSVIWSNRYDQEMNGIFDLQDRIANQIADALRVKLLPGAAGSPGKMPTSNLEAYEYYAKGMSFIKNKYVLYFKEEDFKTGVEMFRKALELDPDSAMAYYGLCWAYEYHYQVHDDEADVAMMEKCAETAQRLDPSSAMTNAVLAYVLYEHRGQREKALELCEKARAINANLGDVVFLTGMCYLYHGLYDLAVRDLSMALALDPYNFWTPYKLAMAHMYRGEFGEADGYFQKYFELAPPLEPLVYPGRNIALQIMMKRYDKAEEMVRRGEETTPGAEWVRKCRALLLAVRGEKDKALASYRSSEVYALLGMKDEAFAALGQEIRGSVFEPYIYYQDLVHVTFYDGLRGDPRFEKLVAREKKLYDAAMRKYGEEVR
jgi:serine/threonine protein kinase/tetratricopeptide (TPR) repeat protein